MRGSGERGAEPHGVNLRSHLQTSAGPGAPNLSRPLPCLETARRESNPGPLANSATVTPVGAKVVTRPRAAFPRYNTTVTVALGLPLPARLTANTRYSNPTPRG